MTPIYPPNIVYIIHNSNANKFTRVSRLISVSISYLPPTNHRRNFSLTLSQSVPRLSVVMHVWCLIFLGIMKFMGDTRRDQQENDNDLLYFLLKVCDNLKDSFKPGRALDLRVTIRSARDLASKIGPLRTLNFHEKSYPYSALFQSFSSGRAKIFAILPKHWPFITLSYPYSVV